MLFFLFVFVFFHFHLSFLTARRSENSGELEELEEQKRRTDVWRGEAGKARKEAESESSL